MSKETKTEYDRLPAEIRDDWDKTFAILEEAKSRGVLDAFRVSPRWRVIGGGFGGRSDDDNNRRRGRGSVVTTIVGLAAVVAIAVGGYFAYENYRPSDPQEHAADKASEAMEQAKESQQKAREAAERGDHSAAEAHAEDARRASDSAKSWLERAASGITEGIDGFAGEGTASELGNQFKDEASSQLRKGAIDAVIPGGGSDVDQETLEADETPADMPNDSAVDDAANPRIANSKNADLGVNGTPEVVDGADSMGAVGDGADIAGLDSDRPSVADVADVQPDAKSEGTTQVQATFDQRFDELSRKIRKLAGSTNFVSTGKAESVGIKQLFDNQPNDFVTNARKASPRTGGFNPASRGEGTAGTSTAQVLSQAVLEQLQQRRNADLVARDGETAVPIPATVSRSVP